MTKMNNDEQLSFEQALQQLEKVVTELEQEDVPLDKLINYYQKGMELVKLSNDMLKNAEEKMTQVLNEDEQIEPFHIEEDHNI